MSSEIVRAVCPHDCPDTCALLVHVEDGKAIAVKGDPEHPTTAGVLCTKVSRYTERTYHADRLLYPQKRTGKKGEGKFERISWGRSAEYHQRQAEDSGQQRSAGDFAIQLCRNHGFAAG